MREEGWPGRDGWYDIAQICLNGHIINTIAKSNPECSMKFCVKCGESTITNCQNCKNTIRGKYHVRGVLSSGGSYIVSERKRTFWKSARTIFSLPIDNLKI